MLVMSPWTRQCCYPYRRVIFFVSGGAYCPCCTSTGSDAATCDEFMITITITITKTRIVLCLEKPGILYCDLVLCCPTDGGSWKIVQSSLAVAAFDFYMVQGICQLSPYPIEFFIIGTAIVNANDVNVDEHNKSTSFASLMFQ